MLVTVGAIELGHLIREARLKKGWQQQDVAARLNVDSAYISAIEGGKRNWPRQYVPDIARVLGLDEVEMAVAAGLISPRPSHQSQPPHDPTDPRELLIERLRGLRLNEDRTITLQGVFDAWETNDRKPKEGG